RRGPARQPGLGPGRKSAGSAARGRRCRHRRRARACAACAPPPPSARLPRRRRRRARCGRGRRDRPARQELSMDASKLKSEVKRALIEELDLRGKSEQDLDETAPLFGEGLGLDSLDALQLAMAIEERFGVKIPEGDEG